MWTKAGQAYDHGTALACDLKIKPSYDETMRVGEMQGDVEGLVWKGD